MGYLKWLQDARLMDEEPGAAGGAATPTTGTPIPTPPGETAPVFTEAQQAHMDSLIINAVTSAVDATNTKRDGLEKGIVKNRDALLKEKKDFQLKLKDNDLAQQMLDGDVEGARKEIKSDLQKNFDTQIKEMQTKLDNTQTTGDNEYRGRVLDTHLNDLKVKSVYQGDMKIALETRSQIVKDEAGVRSLLIDGKPATEHFAAWSNSEDAKNYITVAPSSGGGGQGSDGNHSPSGSAEVLSKLTGLDLIDKAYELKNKK